LDNLYPRLVESLIPHTSRLVALAIQVECSSDFGRIARYLQDTIPTLHKLTIVASSFGSGALELSPGISNSHFMYVKELQLRDIMSFQTLCAFPHVTKLTWSVDPGHGGPVQLLGLLNSLEQLPMLKEVHLVFQTNHYTTTDLPPHMVTLPHVQRMSFHCSKDREVGIPRILELLKLPNLISLIIDAVPDLPSPFPTLPLTSFGKHLPNLAELPEMEVCTRGEIGQVIFRSPSQAVLEYRAVARPLGGITYCHDRWLWGGLPLHSVRRLTVALGRWEKGVGDVWLIRLLRDLGSLDYLELKGYCGGTLRRLRRLMMRRDIFLRIETLTVCSGVYEIHQAMRLKDVADGLGLEIIVTCIPGPGMSDMEGQTPDADGLSEHWDLSSEGENGDGSW
jgi:hypothetical protein